MPNDPLYVQKGFGLKAQIQDLLQDDYHSRVVDVLRENEYALHFEGVTIRLAREFGFCYGVDRAVDLAYETREHFPGKTIYITNEIIHNPYVNRRLVELGVRFLGDRYTIDDVTSDDVVVLPAFGVTAGDFELLKRKGCVLVDTTCGSVLNVWRRVRQYAKDSFTALIHGKYAHEETLATCSQATANGAHYIVVRDQNEAQLVCDVIRKVPGALDRDAFLERFQRAISPGFDPSLHLDRVGVANQTTMLSTESLEIAKMVGQALGDRWSAEQLDAHFRSFDTICSATQDRQDAMFEMAETTDLDLILVIGGYNSSNTMNLAIIGQGFAKTFHINTAAEIASRDEIYHQDPVTKQRLPERGWLPEGPVQIGITAGASTPNRTVGEVIERVLAVRGIELEASVGGGGKRLPLV